MSRYIRAVVVLGLAIAVSLTIVGAVDDAEIRCLDKDNAIKKAYYGDLKGTEEGMRILKSLQSAAVAVKFVLVKDADLPNAYGQCEMTAWNAAGFPTAITIRINSEDFGTPFNLADTIHHELRHAEIFHSLDTTKLADRAHNALDGRPPTDRSNNLFRAQLVIKRLRSVIQSTKKAVEKVTTAVGHLVENLNPFKSSIADSLLHDTLMTPQGYMDFGPSLATQWEMPEDYSSITFNLRDNVTFHDGSPFSAEDVAYTFKHFILDEESESHLRWLFVDAEGNFMLDDVQVLDEYIVRFVLRAASLQTDADEAKYDLLRPFSSVPILSKSLGEEFGHDHTTFLTTGLGPYQLDDYIPYSHLELKRYDNYYFDWIEAAPQNVSLLVMPETATQMAALRYGAIDFILYPAQPNEWWNNFSSDPEFSLLEFHQIDGDGYGGEIPSSQAHFVVRRELVELGCFEGLLGIIDLGGDADKARQNDRIP